MGMNQSTLKKEDLDELQKTSKCTKIVVSSSYRSNHSIQLVQIKELKTMYKQFKKEAPNSEITKEEFVEVLEQMGVSEQILHDVIFQVCVLLSL